MHPKIKAAPSPSEYIPLETTDDDSTTYAKTRDPTTNESTITITIREIATNNSPATTYTTTKDPAVTNKSNTIDDPTTITIDTTSLEPLTSYGGKPPLPPPPSQPISDEQNYSGVVSSLLSDLLLTPSLSDLFVTALLVVLFGYMSILLIQLSKFQQAVDPNIQVHTASLSLYNLSSSQITTEGEITFNVTKPPDCSAAFYDNLVVSLFHMEKPLSVANMESFFQNEIDHTMVKAIFPRTIAPVEKPESGRMARDFNSSSSFEFSFDVNAKGRLWQNYWKSEDVMGEGRQMNVWCPDVKVKIMMETGVGRMAEPAKCTVKTYYD
ncbi:hypothetical protein Vadar_020648 [Vaccinium darrowii]|uniref:Uncharacterized protein n=1 Tax=Vaccinium darrowii TaxID=229202 RepID=A0ACB7Y0J7_9ERIC|nr:hypothetical protein Vadar_020648 [Vaccinium darrowii]